MIKNVQLCYINTGRFIVYIKTDDIYKNIAEDNKNRFDSSNYESDRPFPRGKNKKVIWLMKLELDGKFMTKFIGWGALSYGKLLNRCW